MQAVIRKHDENHAFLYGKMLYNGTMRSFKRSWFLMALVLLVQLPCFCAAMPRFVSRNTHSCCPSEAPAAAMLQAACTHCSSGHHIPLLEQASTSSTDFSQLLFSTLQFYFVDLTPTDVSPTDDRCVNLSHAPPSFIQHCKFIA